MSENINYPAIAENWNTRNADLYVSTNGNDTWTGTRPSPNEDQTDGPLATLSGARDAIRKLRHRDAAAVESDSVVVDVAGGEYQMDAPLELNAEDSGDEDAPVIYRSRTGEESRIVGGRSVSGFSLVTDPERSARLDPSAVGNVYVASLKDLGISDWGTFSSHGWGEGRPGLELFFRGNRMQVARWPNEEFVYVKKISMYPGIPNSRIV